MNIFVSHYFLTVLLLIKCVTSVKDVNLNGLDKKTVESLLKLLSEHKNDVKYVIIEPNKSKPKKHSGNGIETSHNNFLKGRITDNEISWGQDKRFQRPGRHILIKRLLPHGMPPTKSEYDSKYNTLYRPIVRVHKRKVLPKIETILNINGISTGIDKYGIDLYDYFDNDENVLQFATNKEPSGDFKNFKVSESGKNSNVDEELLQPFGDFNENSESSEASSELIILGDIEKLLKKIISKESKAEIYHDVVRILDHLASLRSQKSGEHGNEEHENGEDGRNSPPKPKLWLPHYPPWNFWTYKKTIYQDECPDGQVKIANLCIWVPPH